MKETQVQSLGREDPLEKEMATHSWILAWEMPWTEETCGLRPRCGKRVGQDLATKQVFNVYSVLAVFAVSFPPHPLHHHWVRNCVSSESTPEASKSSVLSLLLQQVPCQDNLPSIFFVHPTFPHNIKQDLWGKLPLFPSLPLEDLE